jgi:hypothetical protein
VTGLSPRQVVEFVPDPQLKEAFSIVGITLSILPILISIREGFDSGCRVAVLEENL